MRVAAIFWLSCGVILDLATANYAGKGQGEVTLLRHFCQMFSKGDMLLADGLIAIGATSSNLTSEVFISSRESTLRCGQQIPKG